MKFFITGITILITVPPDKGDIGTVLEGDEAGRHLQLLYRPHPPSCKERRGIISTNPKIILDPNWLTDSQEEVILNNLTTACA